MINYCWKNKPSPLHQNLRQLLTPALKSEWGLCEIRYFYVLIAITVELVDVIVMLNNASLGIRVKVELQLMTAHSIR